MSQVVPVVVGRDRLVRCGFWASLVWCCFTLVACGKAKSSSEGEGGEESAGQAGSEAGSGAGGTGVGGSNGGTGGDDTGVGGETAGVGGAGEGGSTGGMGATGAVGGSAGAAGSPDYPTCEEMYDGSQARCGATPAYPNDSCRSPYQQRNVNFDDDALGFSARDLVSAFNTPGVGSMVWFDGERTTIHLMADPEVVFGSPDRTFATLNNAPPGEGYCGRDLRLEARDTVFTITSDDGRVDWSLRGTISGYDHGCGIEQVIFSLSGDDELSVELPAEWTLPGASETSTFVQINATVNRCGSCADGDDYCGPEAWGGRLVYESAVYDDTDHLVEYREHVIGEWTWNE